MKLSFIRRVDPSRASPGPTIVAPTAEQSYSPFRMVAEVWPTARSPCCTPGRACRARAEDLIIDVAWSLTENPHRIGAFDLQFTWPSWKSDCGCQARGGYVHAPRDLPSPARHTNRRNRRRPINERNSQADGTVARDGGHSATSVDVAFETTEHSEATPTR